MPLISRGSGINEREEHFLQVFDHLSAKVVLDPLRFHDGGEHLTAGRADDELEALRGLELRVQGGIDVSESNVRDYGHGQKVGRLG